MYQENTKSFIAGFKTWKNLVQLYKDHRRSEYATLDTLVQKVQTTKLTSFDKTEIGQAFKDALVTLKNVSDTDKYYNMKMETLIEDLYSTIKNQTLIVRMISLHILKKLDAISRFNYNGFFNYRKISMVFYQRMIELIRFSDVYKSEEIINGGQKTFKVLIDDKKHIDQLKMTNHTWINLKEAIKKEVQDVQDTAASFRTTNFTIQFEDSKNGIMDFNGEYQLEIRTPIVVKEKMFTRKRTKCVKCNKIHSKAAKPYLRRSLVITCDNNMEGKARFLCKEPNNEAISLNGLYEFYLNYGKQKAAPKFAQMRLNIFTLYDDCNSCEQVATEYPEPIL